MKGPAQTLSRRRPDRGDLPFESAHFVSIRISGGAGRLVDSRHGASFGRVDPAAVGLQATVGSDGAEDRVCGNRSAFTLFDHGIEYGGEGVSALMQKTGGTGVTVEERAMAEAVRIDDALGSLSSRPENRTR